MCAERQVSIGDGDDKEERVVKGRFVGSHAVRRGLHEQHALCARN